MSKTLVATYGTLRPEFGKIQTLAQNPKTIGTVNLEGTLYQNSWFPQIVLEDHPSHIKGTKVECVVVEIDNECVPQLDYFEGAPSFFNKTKVNTKLGEVLVYYWPHPIDDKSVLIDKFVGSFR